MLLSIQAKRNLRQFRDMLGFAGVAFLIYGHITHNGSLYMMGFAMMVPSILAGRR